MKIKALIFLLLVGTGIGFFLFQRNVPTKTPPSSSPEINVQKPISFEASFEIYTNGTKRIFTDPKYHNKSVDVYLESNDPTIVHVRTSGITWGDFFETLPMKLTKDCLITGTGQTFCQSSGGNLGFFINDINQPNALNEEIKPNDHLLVTYK